MDAALISDYGTELKKSDPTFADLDGNNGRADIHHRTDLSFYYIVRGV